MPRFCNAECERPKTPISCRKSRLEFLFLPYANASVFEQRNLFVLSKMTLPLKNTRTPCTFHGPPRSESRAQPLENCQLPLPRPLKPRLSTMELPRPPSMTTVRPFERSACRPFLIRARPIRD